MTPLWPQSAGDGTSDETHWYLSFLIPTKSYILNLTKVVTGSVIAAITTVIITVIATK